MPLPKRLSAYTVEKEILDAVLINTEPLIYELPSKGQAIHTRQRMYYFRRLASDSGDLRYDNLTIEYIGGSKLRLSKLKPSGKLSTTSGEVIPVIPKPAKQDITIAHTIHMLDEFIEQSDDIDLSLLEESDGPEQPRSEGGLPPESEGGESRGTKGRKTGGDG